MRPLGAAQAEVLGAMSALPAALVPIGEALGLVPISSVIAPHPVPPFTNSAMDGFAVRSRDVNPAPVDLRVLEDVPAGQVASQSLVAGTAIKIMTGAPIPDGADAVVRVEDTSQTDAVVTIHVGVAAGTSVRPAGGDVAAGTEIFSKGVRLTSAHIGALANLGIAGLTVHRRPRVALASTGDELVPVDGPALGPGQIRDSNRPMLSAMLKELGVDVIDLGRIPDDAAALRAAIARGVDGADVIVTSGGVSMGEYDLVKKVLGELGNIEFWQVAMQPAKPFAFGKVGGKPLFGLPGNPVSSMVAFEQFVRPGLLKMMGSSRLFRPRIQGRTRVKLSTDVEKTVFVRVRTSTEGEVRWSEPSGGQSSNVLSAVVAGDAFAVVPRGTAEIEAGGSVMLEMFRWPEERTFDDR